MIEIRILNDDQSDLWKKFLLQFSVSQIEKDSSANLDTLASSDNLYLGHVDHHAWAWEWREVIYKTFGHTPYYLAAFKQDEEVIGIMPLFYVKSLLFGSSLISVPYLNAGGILANTPAAFSALLEKAHSIAKERNVNYVELRGREAYDPKSCNLPSRSHKVAMILPLSEDPEKLFQSFPAKLRSQVRRPTKSGVEAKVYTYDQDLQKGLDDFYFVFSRNMRDLGTPVYPKEFFNNALKAFRDKAKIIIAYYENMPVASGITIGGGKHDRSSFVEIPWASSLRSHNKLSPNMLLYWEAVRQACLDRYSHFDFGRSSEGAGTYRFKEQWGAKPQKLFWYYDVINGKIPDVNPNSPKYSLLVSSWQKLPLIIANSMGPCITKWLP